VVLLLIVPVLKPFEPDTVRNQAEEKSRGQKTVFMGNVLGKRMVGDRFHEQRVHFRIMLFFMFNQKIGYLPGNPQCPIFFFSGQGLQLKQPRNHCVTIYNAGACNPAIRHFGNSAKQYAGFLQAIQTFGIIEIFFWIGISIGAEEAAGHINGIFRDHFPYTHIFRLPFSRLCNE